MKREMLRINNLNYQYAPTRKLENISLCVLEGESIGFLGLAYSGKNLLLQILSGEIEVPIQKYSIYVGGKKISGMEMLKKSIYHIQASNYIINNWTVAEYIGLVEMGWFENLLNGRKLEVDVAGSFIELDLEVDVSKKMSALSELEKRVVDLVKAYRQGAKVVIIEDEFTGMRQEEIERFGWIMKRVIMGRMAVIISSHSNMIMQQLSDKYIIFDRGHIVKKCDKNYVKTQEELEEYLLGEIYLSGRERHADDRAEGVQEEDVVYRIKNLTIGEKRLDELQFKRGEIVTILSSDLSAKEKIFIELSGRYKDTVYQKYVEDKIVSIKNLGSREEVFRRMSVGENLILPSLNKISSVEYIRSSGKISKMLSEEIESEERIEDHLAEQLESNELIKMTLERWFIYNPRVLILFEPFALCDAYGVKIVKNYTKKFANRGTSVIIVNTREEYSEDISDRIIKIDFNPKNYHT